jgi:hypothetical protein
MGHITPSFRQLVEIEKLDWSAFKKLLPTKKDKQVFDELFENVILYMSYLGNASNSIPLEYVFIGIRLHNYKRLLKTTGKGSSIDERILKDELTLLLVSKPEGKILFYI